MRERAEGRRQLTLEAIEKYHQRVKEQREMWIEADKKPDPGKKVLASFQNRQGKRRTICGHYLPALFLEVGCDETEAEIEWADDEETAYYTEGWYENIENWDDFSFIAVCEGEVTHWQPLPDHPDGP